MYLRVALVFYIFAQFLQCTAGPDFPHDREDPRARDNGPLDLFMFPNSFGHCIDRETRQARPDTTFYSLTSRCGDANSTLSDIVGWSAPNAIYRADVASFSSEGESVVGAIQYGAMNSWSESTALYQPENDMEVRGGTPTPFVVPGKNGMPAVQFYDPDEGGYNGHHTAIGANGNGPMACTRDNEVKSVRCCNTGSSSPSNGNQCRSVTKDDTNVCLPGFDAGHGTNLHGEEAVTWQEAAGICAAFRGDDNQPGRLCTVQELNDNFCQGTGCNYDGSEIWTNDTCVATLEDVPKSCFEVPAMYTFNRVETINKGIFMLLETGDDIGLMDTTPRRGNRFSGEEIPIRASHLGNNNWKFFDGERGRVGTRTSQAVYEEGGGWRGMNIWIGAGFINLMIYNIPKHSGEVGNRNPDRRLDLRCNADGYTFDGGAFGFNGHGGHAQSLAWRAECVNDGSNQVDGTQPDYTKLDGSCGDAACWRGICGPGYTLKCRVCPNPSDTYDPSTGDCVRCANGHNLNANGGCNQAYYPNEPPDNRPNVGALGQPNDGQNWSENFSRGRTGFTYFGVPETQFHTEETQKSIQTRKKYTERNEPSWAAHYTYPVEPNTMYSVGIVYQNEGEQNICTKEQPVSYNCRFSDNNPDNNFDWTKHNAEFYIDGIKRGDLNSLHTKTMEDNYQDFEDLIVNRCGGWTPGRTRITKQTHPDCVEVDETNDRAWGGFDYWPNMDLGEPEVDETIVEAAPITGDRVSVRNSTKHKAFLETFYIHPNGGGVGCLEGGTIMESPEFLSAQKLWNDLTPWDQVCYWEDEFDSNDKNVDPTEEQCDYRAQSILDRSSGKTWNKKGFTGKIYEFYYWSTQMDDASPKLSMQADEAYRMDQYFRAKYQPQVNIPLVGEVSSTKWKPAGEFKVYAFRLPFYDDLVASGQDLLISVNWISGAALRSDFTGFKVWGRLREIPNPMLRVSDPNMAPTLPRTRADGAPRQEKDFEILADGQLLVQNADLVSINGNPVNTSLYYVSVSGGDPEDPNQLVTDQLPGSMQVRVTCQLVTRTSLAVDPAELVTDVESLKLFAWAPTWRWHSLDFQAKVTTRDPNIPPIKVVGAAALIQVGSTVVPPSATCPGFANPCASHTYPNGHSVPNWAANESYVASLPVVDIGGGFYTWTYNFEVADNFLKLDHESLIAVYVNPYYSISYPDPVEFTYSLTAVPELESVTTSDFFPHYPATLLTVTGRNFAEDYLTSAASATATNLFASSPGQGDNRLECGLCGLDQTDPCITCDETACTFYCTKEGNAYDGFVGYDGVVDFTIEMGGQRSNQFSATMDSPIIDSVSYSESPTRGGSELTITGHNFGENHNGAGTRTLVTLGRTNPAEDLVCAVTRVESTTTPGEQEIFCTVPEGFGTNLQVEVTTGFTGGGTGSSTSVNSAFSYEPPTLLTESDCSLDCGCYSDTNQQCHGPTNNAQAQKRITLRGSNFGNNAAVIEVTVGGLDRLCSPVTILNNHTEISCPYPSGVADPSGLDVVVQVNGGPRSNSDGYAPKFLYDAPVITDNVAFDFAYSTGLKTNGNPGLVTISGINFGRQADFDAASADAMHVKFGGVPLDASYVDSWTDSEIIFRVPPGVAQKDVGVFVYVLADSAAFTTTFTYIRPEIDGLSPPSGPAAGGTRITLTGKSFGTSDDNDRKRVMVGLNECEDLVTSVDHTELTCLTPAGTGEQPVTIQVGTEPVILTSSNFQNFDYDGPQVTTVQVREIQGPVYDDSTAQDRTLSPADGVGHVLRITGTSFGTEASGNRRVTVSLTSGDVVACTDDAIIWQDDLIVCYVPPGQGANKVVTVSVAGKSGASADPQLLSYEAPEITGIEPVGFAWPTDPAEVTTLTIQGKNFGADRSVVQVRVGCRTCAEHVCDLENSNVVRDDAIECILPEGIGLDQVIWVSVDGQENTPDTQLSYAAPVVTSISPESGGQGTVIEVTGRNFGRSGDDATLLVDLLRRDPAGSRDMTLVCAVDDSTRTHTSVQCQAPVGVGTGFSVMVRTQGATNGGNPDVQPGWQASCKDGADPFEPGTDNLANLACSIPVTWAYPRPHISSLRNGNDCEDGDNNDVVKCATSGGARITINGLHFGDESTQPPVNVYMFHDPDVNQYNVFKPVGTQEHSNPGCMDFRGINEQTCVATVNSYTDTAIEVEVVAGLGLEVVVIVEVAGQYSSNTTSLLSYLGPRFIQGSLRVCDNGISGCTESSVTTDGLVLENQVVNNILKRTVSFVIEHPDNTPVDIWFGPPSEPKKWKCENGQEDLREIIVGFYNVHCDMPIAVGEGLSFTIDQLVNGETVVMQSSSPSTDTISFPKPVWAAALGQNGGTGQIGLATDMHLDNSPGTGKNGGPDGTYTDHPIAIAEVGVDLEKTSKGDSITLAASHLGNDASLLKVTYSKPDVPVATFNFTLLEDENNQQIGDPPRKVSDGVEITETQSLVRIPFQFKTGDSVYTLSWSIAGSVDAYVIQLESDAGVQVQLASLSTDATATSLPFEPEFSTMEITVNSSAVTPGNTMTFTFDLRVETTYQCNSVQFMTPTTPFLALTDVAAEGTEDLCGPGVACRGPQGLDVNEFSRFQCTTVPGISGSDLAFVVSAFGQESDPSTSTYSYPEIPVIQSVQEDCTEPNCACTSTGLAVTDCPTTALNSLGNPIRLLITLLEGDGYGEFPTDEATVLVHMTAPSTAINEYSGLDFRCSDFERIQGTQSGLCTLPEGAGQNLGVYLEFTESQKRSETVELISYARPTVTSISGCTPKDLSTVECNRQGGDTLAVEGANFGPAGATVFAGGKNCLNEDIHDPASRHSLIRCDLPAGVGINSPILIFQAGVINSDVNPPTFSYAPCPTGKYQLHEKDYACTPCEFGQFQASPGALGSCEECPSGRYQGSEGNSDCEECNAGEYSEQTREVFRYTYFTETQHSGAGIVGTESTLSDAKIACNSDSTCVAISQEMGTTGAFQLHLAGSTQPDSARQTWTKAQIFADQVPRGAHSCTACEAGTSQQNPRSSQCNECDAGTYRSSNDDAQRCLLCDEGYFASAPACGGSDDCVQISEVPFPENVTTTSCAACGPGRFSPQKGGTKCSPCQPGKFAEDYHSTGCDQCPRGRHSENGGAFGSDGSKCDACLAGTYSPEMGATTCKSCEVGRFSNTSLAEDCHECEPGKFQDEPNEMGCTNCIAGRYQGSDGQALCNPCDPGYYAPASNARECIECQAGRYDWGGIGERSDCLDCVAGKYASSLASLFCTVCEPGKFTDQPVQPGCQLCPIGRYQDGLDSDGNQFNTLASGFALPIACKACPAGEYQRFEGQRSCDECEPGTASNVTATNTTCALCPPGYHTDSQSGERTCTECPAGFFARYSGTATCEPCPVGYYQDAEGQDECKKCPAGYYQDETGKTICNPCESGEYAAGQANIGCLPCEPGFYANAQNTSECTKCSTGYFQHESGQDHCEPCPAGTFADTEGSDVCTLCGPGTSAPGLNSTRCGLCGRGTYQDGTDNLGQPWTVHNPTVGPGGSFPTQCKSCEIGRFINAEGQVSCEPCGPGTFADSTGTEECTLCDEGYSTMGASIENFGFSECAKCEVGKYQAEKGASSCNDCTAGTFSSLPGAELCTPCAAGRYGEGSQLTSCPQCPSGRFQSSTGQSSCVDCAPGRFNDGSIYSDACPALLNETSALCTSLTATGATACTADSSCRWCPTCNVCIDRIQFCPGTQCVPCAKGTSKIGVGAGRCEPCALGYYSLTLGQPECDPCEPGKYAGTEGSEECTECEAGRSQPFEHRDSCILCEEGEYQTERGQPECTLCEPGSFSDEPGFDTVCTPCPAGRSQFFSGKNFCNACDPGKFQSSTGQPECSLCEVGTASNDTALDEACPDCSPGRHQEYEGQVQCNECQMGKYTVAFKSATCSECAPGYFANVTGLDTQCPPCAAGKFSNEQGATGCISCDPGTFQTDEGQRRCYSCPAGTKSDVEGRGTLCDQCTEGQYQSFEGEQECNGCRANNCRMRVPKAGLNLISGDVQSTFPVGDFDYDYSTDCDVILEMKKALDAELIVLDPSAIYPFNSSGQTFNVTVSVLKDNPIYEEEWGEYQPNPGQAECFTCQPGKYQNLPNNVECQDCIAGRYQPNRNVYFDDAFLRASFEQFLTDPGLGQPTNISGVEVTIPKSCPVNGMRWIHPLYGVLEVFDEENWWKPREAPYWRSMWLKQELPCLPCPPGTFSQTGADRCRQCEDNKVSAVPGSSQCQACKDNASPNADQTECVCDPGYMQTYNESAGTRDEDRFTCMPCPFGGNCRAQGTSIANLPNEVGFWRASLDTTNFVSCLRQAHCTGGRPPEGHQECFEELVAEEQALDTGEEETTDLVFGECYTPATSPTRTLQEYQQLANRRFLDGDGCAANLDLEQYKAEDNYLVLMSSICAPARTGPLCALCADGYYEGIGQQCYECFTTGASDASIWTTFAALIIALIVVMIGIFFFVVRSGKKLFQKADIDDAAHASGTHQHDVSSHDADLIGTNVLTALGPPSPPPDFTYKFKIAFGFAQIVATVSNNMELRWPSLFQEFIGWFDFLDFAKMSSMSCLNTVSFYTQWTLVMLLPIILIALLIAFFLIPRLFIKCVRSGGNATDVNSALENRKIQRKFWRVLLFILFMLYPMVSSYAFRIWNCKEVAGVDYLRADFREECYTLQWQDYQFIAIPFVLLYPIGIPIFFTYIVYKGTQERYRGQSIQEVKEKGQPPEGLSNSHVKARLGFLYAGYNHNIWWWEVLDMLHKLFLTSILQFFSDVTVSVCQGGKEARDLEDPSICIAENKVSVALPIGMFVVATYFLLLLLLQPYIRKGDDRLHQFAQAEIFLLLLAGYIFEDNRFFIPYWVDLTMTVILISATCLFLLFFIIQAGLAVKKKYKNSKAEKKGKTKDLNKLTKRRRYWGADGVELPVWPPRWWVLSPNRQLNVIASGPVEERTRVKSIPDPDEDLESSGADAAAPITPKTPLTSFDFNAETASVQEVEPSGDSDDGRETGATARPADVEMTAI